MRNHLTIDDMGMSEEINRALQENPQAAVGEIIRQKVAKDAAKEIEAETQNARPSVPVLSMEYVLTRIDQIINDTDYIQSAIKALQELQIAPYPGTGADVANAQRAEALGNVVQSRETTNQQLIKLLEKMYDDLKPREPSDEILKLRQLTDTLCRYPKEVSEDIIRKSTQQMFVKAGAEIVK